MMELIEIFHDFDKSTILSFLNWLKAATEEEKRNRLVSMHKQLKGSTNPICGCISKKGHLIYENDCKICKPNAAIASANRKNTNTMINTPNTPEETYIVSNIGYDTMLDMGLYEVYHDKPIPSSRVAEFEDKCFSRLKNMLPKYKVSNKLDHTFKGRCDPRFFRWHIERQLKPGWRLGQYRKNIWDLDHIIPCGKEGIDLKNPEHIKKVFHWNNIRPMEAKKNRSKGAR